VTARAVDPLEGAVSYWTLYIAVRISSHSLRVNANRGQSRDFTARSSGRACHVSTVQPFIPVTVIPSIK
jgi:hypothetical protein